MPWNGEHHAPVGRMRNQNRRFPWQERLVENQVDALRRRDHRCRVGIGQLPHAVAECPRGVDHHPRPQFKLAAGHPVQHPRAIDEPVVAAQQVHGFAMVHRRRAPLDRRQDHLDQQSGVVELAVVINHAAA